MKYFSRYRTTNYFQHMHYYRLKSCYWTKFCMKPSQTTTSNVVLNYSFFSHVFYLFIFLPHFLPTCGKNVYSCNLLAFPWKLPTMFPHKYPFLLCIGSSHQMYLWHDLMTGLALFIFISHRVGLKFGIWFNLLLLMRWIFQFYCYTVFQTQYSGLAITLKVEFYYKEKTNILEIMEPHHGRLHGTSLKSYNNFWFIHLFFTFRH